MVPSSKEVLDVLVTRENNVAEKKRVRFFEGIPNKEKPISLCVHGQMPLHSGYRSALESGSRVNLSYSTNLLNWENFCSIPQFPHLKSEDNNSTILHGVREQVKVIILMANNSSW